MSQPYNSDHKAAVMVALERNGGDIETTARQTGVPVRTLRDWRGKVLPYLPPPPPSARQTLAETPAFANDLEALAFIRQNIIGELSRLSASLQHDPGFSTPYQRALVMSQLMDKLLKLDLHLRPYMDDDEDISVFEGEDDWMEGFADEEPDCDEDDEDEDC